MNDPNELIDKFRAFQRREVERDQILQALAEATYELAQLTLKVQPDNSPVTCWLCDGTGNLECLCHSGSGQCNLVCRETSEGAII